MNVGNPYLTSSTRILIWQILDAVMELDGIPDMQADFRYSAGATVLEVRVTTLLAGMSSSFFELIQLPTDERPLADATVQHEVWQLLKRLRDLLNHERIAAAALERNEAVAATLERMGVAS